MSTALDARVRPITLEVTAAPDLATNFSMDWEERVACRGIVTYPNLFAPTTPAEEAAARSVCATCEVAYECLILGLSSWGGRRYIYGGLNNEQRLALPKTPQMEHDIEQIEQVLEAAEPWNLV